MNKAIGFPCQWCGEPLKYVVDKGYVHRDGELYKRRAVPCGRCKGSGQEWVDDHCALPRRS